MERENKEDSEEKSVEHPQQEEQQDFIQIRTNTPSTSTSSPSSHAENHPGKQTEKHAEHNQKENKEMQEADASKTFFIALGVFIAILIAIFLIPRFMNQEPLTLSEVHQENLEEGEETETQYVYNSYSFVYYDGLWYTQILNQFSGELYDVPLHFGPKNLTDIIITGDLNEYFSRIAGNNISNYTYQTYLTFDPNEEEMGYIALATGELTQNLARTFGIAFIPACTEEGTGCENVPIITCNSTDAPVVHIKIGTPTVIYAQDNCLTIQGEGKELVRAVDRFLLKLYNIMI